MAGFSEQSVSTADGAVERGKPVPGSRYYRDYCYICHEPIRVTKRNLRVPNACSGCMADYRGRPGISAAVVNWFIERFGDVPSISR